MFFPSQHGPESYGNALAVYGHGVIDELIVICLSRRIVYAEFSRRFGDDIFFSTLDRPIHCCSTSQSVALLAVRASIIFVAPQGHHPNTMFLCLSRTCVVNVEEFYCKADLVVNRRK